MLRPVPTHVRREYVRRIREDVWLLSVVWSSNHVQCVYFKFRRRTQEISRNKTRRNWQCTEWKKLMTWIIQPANRGQQEWEEGEERGCRHSHCALPTVLSGACKVVTFHAAVTSSVFMGRLGFGGHKCVTVSGEQKRSPPNSKFPLESRFNSLSFSVATLRLDLKGRVSHCKELGHFLRTKRLHLNRQVASTASPVRSTPHHHHQPQLPWGVDEKRLTWRQVDRQDCVWPGRRWWTWAPPPILPADTDPTKQPTKQLIFWKPSPKSPPLDAFA